MIGESLCVNDARKKYSTVIENLSTHFSRAIVTMYKFTTDCDGIYRIRQYKILLNIFILLKSFVKTRKNALFDGCRREKITIFLELFDVFDHVGRGTLGVP